MADAEAAQHALAENLNFTTDEELAVLAEARPGGGLRKLALAAVALLAAAGAALAAHGALRPSASVAVLQEAALAAYAHPACNGCSCDCGWAQGAGACAAAPSTQGCCYACCCGGAAAGVPFPNFDAMPHGDAYHGAMPLPVTLPQISPAYDPIPYNGDQYHGAAPTTCKYTTGSHVYVQGAGGAWHHAVVVQVRPGCSYQVQFAEHPDEPHQHFYSARNPQEGSWWSANWWWVCFLMLLALLAGIFIAMTKKS